MSMKSDMGLKAPTFSKVKIGNLTHGAIAKPKKQRRKTMDDLKLKLSELEELMAEFEDVGRDEGVVSSASDLSVEEARKYQFTRKSPLYDIEDILRVLKLVPEAAKALAKLVQEFRQAAGPVTKNRPRMIKVMKLNKNAMIAASTRSRILGVLSEIHAIGNMMPHWTAQVKKDLAWIDHMKMGL